MFTRTRTLVVKLHNSVDESVRGPSRTFLLDMASAVEQALTRTTLVSCLHRDSLISRWRRVYILHSSIAPFQQPTTLSSDFHRRRLSPRSSPLSNEERGYVGCRTIRMIDGPASSLSETRPYLWLMLCSTNTVYLRLPR